MFEACSTYEVGSLEPKDFPPTDEPVWILGKKYSALYDLDELRADVKTKLWFTYRKNFAPIGGSGPSSDYGWGCMLRCGQMVLAESLVRCHLGREWLWSPGSFNATCTKIIKLFEDKKNAIYSIHQIAQMGVSEGKEVGQWFGPNTVAQVLRKLAVYDDWNSIVIHIAMDNTVIINEIKRECKIEETAKDMAGHKFNDVNNGFTKSNGIISEKMYDKAIPRNKSWRPLLLFVPLRLGLSEINPLYIRGLKKCFSLKQSLGVIGGKPNHASYFIGFVGDELVYLDPHTTQPTVCLDCVDPEYKNMVEDSYHCSTASRMDFVQLDPSIAVCFYCHTEDEFDTLCEQIQKLIVEQESQPLFEICSERQWFAEEYKVQDCDNSEYTVIENRKFDTSDDEFEIL